MRGASERDVAARLAALEIAEGPQPVDERRAAVALILRFADRELGPEVLLMKRVQHPNDRWSGQISLPGGHAGPDEELLRTAMREAHEEVCLDLEHVGRLLGRLPRVQAKARGRLLPMGITPFVFTHTGTDEPSPGEEAEETFWFPLASAASGELSATYRYERDSVVHQLPCWRYEGRIVWGLTHEMLSGFLRVASG